MNRIYRDAAHILVWLGLDTEKEAASAFSLVRELDGILSSRFADSPSSVSNAAKLVAHIRENKKVIQALTDRAWVSLSLSPSLSFSFSKGKNAITGPTKASRVTWKLRFTQFRRGWIVQEIGTDTPATMYWGDATVDWATLASVCGRLKSYHHLRAALGISTSDISFLYRRFIEPDENTHHANRFNFVYELQRARHLNFSDDRDRVFAFLGHYSVRSLHPLGCGPLSITADYTKTVEQLYIDVAVRILRQRPAAVCILLAAVQHPSSIPALSSIPSSICAPNWSCWVDVHVTATSRTRVGAVFAHGRLHKATELS